MSPGRGPRSLLICLVSAVSLLAVGCGEGGDITAVGEPQGVTTTAGEATTAASDDTTPETLDERTTDVSETTTTAVGSDGTETTTAADAGGAPDQTATDVSWTSSPGEFRGQDGLRVAYDCTPGGSPGSVWGVGPFTDDSSVCTAGVFAGVITVAGGGRVVVRIAPGLEEYGAGAANGITTSAYGTWAGSYVVLTG